MMKMQIKVLLFLYGLIVLGIAKHTNEIKLYSPLLCASGSFKLEDTEIATSVNLATVRH